MGYVIRQTECKVRVKAADVPLVVRDILFHLRRSAPAMLGPRDALVGLLREQDINASFDAAGNLTFLRYGCEKWFDEKANFVALVLRRTRKGCFVSWQGEDGRALRLVNKDGKGRTPVLQYADGVTWPS